MDVLTLLKLTAILTVLMISDCVCGNRRDKMLKGCQLLESPPNGNQLVIRSSKVKKYALFSCDKGFKLVGSRVRVCEKHGRQYRWDGSDATCLAIDYCEQSLCFNDGSCTEEEDGYTCICPSGFTGDHCETDINDCSPDPCSPGGTCIDGVYSYTCVCKPGYTGDNCDI
ncbi:unnamed protein product, partial [Owenia fusiformis]